MHTGTTTIATTIRIKIMVAPIDTPATVPIELVVTGVEVLLVVLALSVNGIESVI